MTSVLLVDDEALVRKGFRLILEGQPDIEIVGEASTGREAVALAAALAPDVVLVDIKMPEMDGLEATRQILAGPHAPRIIVLTTFGIDDYIYDALRAGASGFLLKAASPEELTEAVRLVAAGNAVLQPSVTTRLVEGFAHGRTSSVHYDDSELAELTSREVEVFTLLAAALSNAEIGRALVISESTAKTHVARVLMKLDLHDRAQAVVRAYEIGLVRPGQRSVLRPE